MADIEIGEGRRGNRRQPSHCWPEGQIRVSQRKLRASDLFYKSDTS